MAWSTPATWVAGIPTVANFNERIRDQFNALGDPWTSYTPAWTGSGSNPAIGNGTLAGKYRQIGKSIDYEINILMGSTTTFGSGTYSFSLPVTASASVSYHPMGWGIVRDGGAAPLVRFPTFSSTTTVNLIDVAGTIVAATVPFTFANTDRIIIAGQYEAA